MRSDDSRQRFTRRALLIVALATLVSMTACHHDSSPRGQTLGQQIAPGEVAWQAPDPDVVPAGADGQSILRGQDLFAHTATSASQYVGNQLNCGDCHLHNGAQAFSAPLVGVTHRYPAFNKRAGKVIDLKERIQECMVRSENGRPLPDDSDVIHDLVAYMTWLSQSVPAGARLHGTGLIQVAAPAQVDASKGASLYANICANCHGANGAGTPPAYPPLWGPNSFNSGAGMAQPQKMAAFILKNMPYDSPGTLTVQQAFDIAAFVDSHPRPAMNDAYKRY